MKLFFILLGVLTIVMSAEVAFSEHETVVVDAWEADGQTLLHYKF